MFRKQAWHCLAICAGALLIAVLPAWGASDPFVDEVVSFLPGEHAGFGTPDLVLGPPVGAGELQGSTHTLSLGDGGSIVVRFDEPGLCDRPGPDLIIFENAFYAGSRMGPLFVEVGIVALSVDGIHFVEIPFDAQTFDGLAGRTPVYSNPDNGIPPTAVSEAGGDSFDLASVGLATARYVRITDPGMAIADAGNRVVPGNSGGFDLDAMASLHDCNTVAPSATPTPSATLDVATPTPTSTPRLATVTATTTPTLPTVTPTSTATVSPSITPTPRLGDVDGSGRVDDKDLNQVIAAIFARFPASADANHDGVLSAADVIAVAQDWSP